MTHEALLDVAGTHWIRERLHTCLVRPASRLAHASRAPDSA
jgi:hypothetical protein